MSNGWCRRQACKREGRVLLAVWLEKALGKVSLLVQRVVWSVRCSDNGTREGMGHGS